MKFSVIAGAVLCLGLFVTAAPGQDSSAMPMAGMAMGQHDDINSLVDRLNKSLAAIEAAKKSSVRKQLLAEHGALLKELQSAIEAGGMAGMPMGKDTGKGMDMGKSMDMGKGMDMSSGKGGMCCNMAGMSNGATGGGMNCGEMPGDQAKPDPEPKK